jgi:hypothetical protein
VGMETSLWSMPSLSHCCSHSSRHTRPPGGATTRTGSVT